MSRRRKVAILAAMALALLAALAWAVTGAVEALSEGRWRDVVVGVLFASGPAWLARNGALAYMDRRHTTPPAETDRSAP